MTTYDLDTPVETRGTGSIQWDVLPAHHGLPDLLPFTIADMDFRSPPEVLEALHRRVDHGVFGYTDWQHSGFPEAVRDWYGERYGVAVAPQTAGLRGFRRERAVAQLLRMWTEPGDGVVVHTRHTSGSSTRWPGWGGPCGASPSATTRPWNGSSHAPTPGCCCCAPRTTRPAGCGRRTS